jgi:hypothetical protein
VKKPLILIVLAVAIASILLATCCDYQGSVWGKFKNPETETMLKRFVAMKIKQANASTNNLPPEFQTMFKYAQRGDWLALSNSVRELDARIEYRDSLGYGIQHWHGFRGAVEDFISGAAEQIGLHWEPQPPPRLQGTPGEAIKEIYGALDGFVTGDEKYSAEFGRDIIASIPAGSIYFGGSDSGRYIVTAMCQSQVNGDPFFTLAQNALGNNGYRQYLRNMYGKIIYIPMDGDSQKCHEKFMEDSERRMSSNQSPSVMYSVMYTEELLAKIVFDNNSNHEFYVNESYPIDWMYPRLEPNGLIFKLDRQPAATLSDETVQRDHEYWTNYIRPMIGDWLNENTSIAEIAAFAEKTYGRRDFRGFKGDPRYIQNAYSQRTFSKSRAAIAGLYGWHADHAANPADKEHMLREADFAFRQAWALGPCSPEPVFRYVYFLVAQSRLNDALVVGETDMFILRMRGVDNEQLEDMVKQLKDKQSQNPPVDQR